MGEIMKNKSFDLAYIAIAAALISICSWITIPLPSGIPVTLQTFGVCTAAGILGFKRGTAATAVYIVLGLIGMPVYSAFRSGPATLFGNTGGYIIGFIFTAMITGIASDFLDKEGVKYKKERFPLFMAMCSGVLICYAFGTLWFATVWAKSGDAVAISTILGWCVLPYIIPDIIKLILAVFISLPVKRFIKKYTF